MERYKHNFKDGDIVTDIEYNEVFKFSDKTDGQRAEDNPTKLRLANDVEKDELSDSGEECTTLSIQAI